MQKNCAVLMMQKNEGILLQAWIDYYTYIYSPHQIYIYDNGSTDQLTLEILDAAKSLDINVFSMPGKEFFCNKGDIFLSFIKTNRSKYDYFYLVDCDEFLVRFNGYENFNIVKNLIPEESDSSIELYRINSAIWNVPKTTSGYYHEMRKLIVKNNFNGDHIDFGLHLFDFKNNTDMYDARKIAATSIGLLHFHNRPFDVMVKTVKEKLEGRVNYNDPEAIKKYAGDGVHLIKYLTMSESDYSNYLNNNMKFDLSKEFFENSLRIPFN